jgi:predicted nucleic acid-binding protein
MYFAYDAGGWPMQNALWELVRRGEFRLQVPDEGTEVRMQELMEQYRDTPMDLADASLVVAAELLGSSRIFTTDSDFYVYRRNGNLPFEVLP